MERIPFNKPYFTGTELEHMRSAVASGHISGDGHFTKKCHEFFESHFGFGKSLLTTSCTDALEMAAILADIQPGDEVIIPSFTFVSTANAFAIRGAKIVFADSTGEHPNIDVARIEELITSKTKAVVPVHYAGMACDMDRLMALCAKHNIMVIEDAAQAIDSYYQDKPLGSFGTMSTFSFHETKNLICGEGGMLALNDSSLYERAEIIREKGTNRSAFFRGEIDKYGWVDVGSSYLPSDLLSAVLWAQLEHLGDIQQRRGTIWQRYAEGLDDLFQKGVMSAPIVPQGATNNYHMFYVLCPSLDERSRLLQHLKAAGVHAVFHYQSLHQSPYYASKHDGRPLPNADRFTHTLVRLPFFYELTEDLQARVIDAVRSFYLR